MADETQQNDFNAAKHLIKVQGGRLYLPVSARLTWFRQEHPLWGIETEIVAYDREAQYAVCRAMVKDETGRIVAMGTKQEDVKGFGDYLEKAEKGAIGRALGVCGYGTDDIDDEDIEAAKRPCDAPSNRGQQQRPAQPQQPRSQAAPQPQQTPFSEAGRERANVPPANGTGAPKCSCGRTLTPKQASGELPCPTCGQKAVAA